MADDTFASFARKVEAFEKALADDKLGHAVGKMAKAESEKAASADLGGDPKFSGWAPTLATRYDLLNPGKVGFKPTRRAAGPWTVAEFGRHSAEGPRMVGPRLTKTGKVSRAKQKRWNGRTEGKGTASKALGAIDDKVSGVVDKEVTQAIRKFFD